MTLLLPTTYILNAPMMALNLESTRKLRLTQIPESSSVELKGDFKSAGMVKILWNGAQYAVFEQDLESRSKQI